MDPNTGWPAAAALRSLAMNAAASAKLWPAGMGQTSNADLTPVLSTYSIATLPALITLPAGLKEQSAAHRLLTFDRDPMTRGPTVEVAHEALLREWGRLRGVDRFRARGREGAPAAGGRGARVGTRGPRDKLPSHGGEARTARDVESDLVGRADRQ